MQRWREKGIDEGHLPARCPEHQSESEKNCEMDKNISCLVTKSNTIYQGLRSDTPETNK